VLTGENFPARLGADEGCRLFLLGGEHINLRVRKVCEGEILLWQASDKDKEENISQR